MLRCQTGSGWTLNPMICYKKYSYKRGLWTQIHSEGRGMWWQRHRLEICRPKVSSGSPTLEVSPEKGSTLSERQACLVLPRFGYCICCPALCLWSHHQSLPGWLLLCLCTLEGGGRREVEGQNEGIHACSCSIAFHFKLCICFETYRKCREETISASDCVLKGSVQRPSRISDWFWAARYRILLPGISLTMLSNQCFTPSPLSQQLWGHPLILCVNNSTIWQHSKCMLPDHPIPSLSHTGHPTCALKVRVTSWGWSRDTNAPFLQILCNSILPLFLQPWGKQQDVIEETMDLGLFNGLISLNDLGKVPSSLRVSVSSLVTRGAYLDASKAPSSVSPWTKLRSPTMHPIPSLPWHHQSPAPHLSSSTSVSLDPSPLLKKAFPQHCHSLTCDKGVMSFLLIIL